MEAYQLTDEYYDFLEAIRLAKSARDFEHVSKLTLEMNEKFPTKKSKLVVPVAKIEKIEPEENVDWLELLMSYSD